MGFKLICVVLLFVGGCNAGVVPQHFISNHTVSVNVELEKLPTHEVFKAEISNIAAGDEDLNSSVVSIVGSHNITELILPKDNVSEASHLFGNNHSKEFDHSQKGVAKGSGRSRKKASKGRFKKSTAKETKKVEKVTNDHFNKDALKESHHLEDFVTDLSHPNKNFSKVSDHAANLTEDHFQDTLNESHHLGDFVTDLSHPNKDISKVSDHAANLTDHFKDTLNGAHHEHFMNGSKNFHKDFSEVTDHVENITNINFDQHEINGSDHADKIVEDFNHFNNLLNESHQEDVLNNPDSDIPKGFHDFGNVSKPVHQQIERQALTHFENVPETRNETLRGFEINESKMTDHFNSTSGLLDATAENSSNSLKILDDHIAFKEHQVENISGDINLRPSDLNNFHEDIHSIDAENRTHSEMNPLFDGFNSSETAPKLNERLSTVMDIHISKENSSALNPTLLEDSTLNSHPFNGEAYVMFPNENDTNSNTELSNDFLRDLQVNTNESKLNAETNDSKLISVEENATESLLSGISLDFFFNSELAKNAASAMEVFNFTDSALTDHIMDDKNDVHDFLDLIHPPLEESDQSNSKEESHDGLNMRENLNGIDPGLTSEDGERFQVATAVPLLNSTVEFEETSVVSQPMINSTVEFEEPTTIVSVFNSSVGLSDAICPPPGFCIFWFLAQDTCAVNSHCLGSRICCRIGCAKTCIEV